MLDKYPKTTARQQKDEKDAREQATLRPSGQPVHVTRGFKKNRVAKKIAKVTRQREMKVQGRP